MLTTFRIRAIAFVLAFCCSHLAPISAQQNVRLRFSVGGIVPPEQAVHPPSHSFSFTVNGTEVHVEAKLNSALFAARYTETQLVHGDVVELPASARSNAPENHCYYVGTARGDPSSTVAFDTCNGGITGRIVAHGMDLVVGPADGKASAALARQRGRRELDISGIHHSIGPFEQDVDEDSECGHHHGDKLGNPNLPLPEVAAGANRSRRQTVTGNTDKYVEVLVMNDHARYLQAGADNVASDAVATMNIVHALYRNPEGIQKWNDGVTISIAIKAMHTVVDADPWDDASLVTVDGPVDPFTLLTQFNSWSGYQAAHDNHVLLSGRDFNGFTVGLAYIGVMCYAKGPGQFNPSGSINQWLRSASRTASVVAHELGHNFGMEHDDGRPDLEGGACPSSGKVMSAVGGATPDREWTGCSANYLGAFLGGQYEYMGLISESGLCLENDPSGSQGQLPTTTKLTEPLTTTPTKVTEPEPTCVDKQTPGADCATRKSWGGCSAEWLIQGGYCEKTCFNCGIPLETTTTTTTVPLTATITATMLPTTTKSSTTTKIVPTTTTTMTVSPKCIDKQPPGADCATRKSWGGCNKSWLRDGGYCENTCFNCGESEPAAPPPPPPTCVDKQPPGADCATRKSWGGCNKSWLRDGGYCENTCFNCGNPDVKSTTEEAPTVQPTFAEERLCWGKRCSPKDSWADSYSVDGVCYCGGKNGMNDGHFGDHGILSVQVQTPIGVKTVGEICTAIGEGPLEGRIYYNDVQCGNGPANDAGDEDADACPGRVDMGYEGCGILGPKWDLSFSVGNTASLVAKVAAADDVPTNTVPRAEAENHVGTIVGAVLGSVATVAAIGAMVVRHRNRKTVGVNIDLASTWDSYGGPNTIV